ncbi:hypothetical protein K0M31_015250 [Melipona bicolor]|uniref:Uncharacterized protein n=1 Tax=Melipona bicolor TaxID=60889 RepID=A0AA40KF84_9HYME|nr:hypothetical protein K0M31_015250 [Melipona bicolor]
MRKKSGRGKSSQWLAMVDVCVDEDVLQTWYAQSSFNILRKREAGRAQPVNTVRASAQE